MTIEHRIVFVCTGNTCRSPMAAALFNKMNTLPGWTAESCGIFAIAGEKAGKNAEIALKLDFDIDLTSHLSRPVTSECLETADWILTMTPSQRDLLHRSMPELAGRIMTAGEMIGQPGLAVPDPYGGDLAVYRETASILAGIVKKIIDVLAKISDIGEGQSGDSPV